MSTFRGFTAAGITRRTLAACAASGIEPTAVVGSVADVPALFG